MLMAPFQHPLLLSPGRLSACLRVLRFQPVFPETGTGAPFKMHKPEGILAEQSNNYDETLQMFMSKGVYFP